MKDPYEILGVDHDASDEDIKKAYRKLALEWHPDRHNGDVQAEERFKEINAAYQAIGTPEARQQQGPGAANIDIEDLMAQMGFGRFGFNPFRRQRRTPTTPRIRLPISLEEAHKGCSKRVTVRREDPCAACGGRGRTGGTACEQCSGSGQVDVGISAVMRMVSTCQACSGSGLGGPPCENCSGRGRTVQDRTISVEIPKGAEAGMMLPSDGVMVTIDHLPHARYRKLTDTDVMSQAQIDALDAMLGTQISVRTLAGEMKMKVPAGIQPGARLRIAGAGLYHRSGRKGDHIVQIGITVPELTTEQKRALEQLRADRVTREKDDGYEAE